MSKLAEIQEAVKAPKNKNNNFGKYKYRNFEDICEAVKPVLAKFDADLTVSDSIENVGNRFYLVATATLSVDGKTYQAKGYAREGESKTGMDVAQLTGACSSYARKYALCALFLIDGSEDFDEMDNREEGKAKPATAKDSKSDKLWEENSGAKSTSEDKRPGDKRKQGFVLAMQGLIQRNKKVACAALGALGYEKPEDVPLDKIDDVYRAVRQEFEK